MKTKEREKMEKQEKKMVSIELKVRTAKQIRPEPTVAPEKKDLLNIFYNLLTDNS